MTLISSDLSKSSKFPIPLVSQSSFVSLHFAGLLPFGAGNPEIFERNSSDSEDAWARRRPKLTPLRLSIPERNFSKKGGYLVLVG